MMHATVKALNKHIVLININYVSNADGAGAESTMPVAEGDVKYTKIH
jgi:hypothetical protein